MAIVHFGLVKARDQSGPHPILQDEFIFSFRKSENRTLVWVSYLSTLNVFNIMANRLFKVGNLA